MCIIPKTKLRVIFEPATYFYNMQLLYNQHFVTLKQIKYSLYRWKTLVSVEVKIEELST